MWDYISTWILNNPPFHMWIYLNRSQISAIHGKHIRWLQPFMYLSRPGKPICLLEPFTDSWTVIHESLHFWPQSFTHLGRPSTGLHVSGYNRSNRSRTSTVHEKLIHGYTDFGLNKQQQQPANHHWISTVYGKPYLVNSQHTCRALH